MVKEITYFVHEEFNSLTYESCKNVQYPEVIYKYILLSIFLSTYIVTFLYLRIYLSIYILYSVLISLQG